MRYLAVLAITCSLCTCANDSSGVAAKVLSDFGLRERPEGHERTTDRVFDRLDAVGKAELKRLNLELRHGEIKFQDAAGFRGKFYKEVKVYEDYYPLDVRPVSKTSSGKRGYAGYIDFRYRVHQSVRKNTRAEASAASATIRMGDIQQETFKYTFGPGGAWDGAKGVKTR